jgi:hypothetical protein
MRCRLNLLILSAALGSGAGCSDGEDFAKPDRRLESTSWRMETLGGEAIQSPPGGGEPTLSFKAGFATWTVGCNRFDAQYRTDGDRLDLRTQPGQVIGGCEPFERPLRTALVGDGLSFEQEGRRMRIRTPAGALELRRVRFQPIGPR